MAPEFLGIYLFYLESKVIAWRTITLLLALLVCTTAVYVVHIEDKLMDIQYDIEEGNSVKCESGYISKVVEGSKVSCIMRRVGPGWVTYKKRIK